MSNMSKESMLPENQEIFINQLTNLLMPWGMTSGVARLYAYLLLQEQPVSLDQICEDLHNSKSTVSVAARTLEQSRMVIRHSVPGTRRVLYSAVQDTKAKMSEHAEMLGQFADLMQQKPAIVASKKVQQSMHEYGEFCRFMQVAISNALEEWRNQKAGD